MNISPPLIDLPPSLLRMARELRDLGNRVACKLTKNVEMDGRTLQIHIGQKNPTGANSEKKNHKMKIDST